MLYTYFIYMLHSKNHCYGYLEQYTGCSSGSSDSTVITGRNLSKSVSVLANEVGLLCVSILIRTINVIVE